MKKEGRLFGIGVGPGDPELMTVKAVRVLRDVQVIFAAASSGNNYSVALEIARSHIPREIPVIKLSFPMIPDRSAQQKAWKKNVDLILKELEKGHDAAFLTLGDPLIYSTYGYIITEMGKIIPPVEIETIPGITSFQAAAALTGLPLVEGEESLLVISGSRGGEYLRKSGGQADNIVMLKTYRHLKDIYSILREMDLLETTTVVRNCGQADEKVITDFKEMVDEPPHYFTLLLIKNKTKGNQG